MVRTDQMWRYTRTVMIAHYHGDGNYETLTWEPVIMVEPSPIQGWNFTLECGCTLQSCFGEMEINVKMIPHPDVAAWGKPALPIRTDYDANGDPIGVYAVTF
jgi:hypothetical protein